MSANEISREEIINLVKMAMTLGSQRVFHASLYLPVSEDWKGLLIDRFSSVNAAIVANILYKANRASITDRYGKCWAEETEILSSDFPPRIYKFDEVQFLHSLNYYTYQSCEGNAWRNSVAYEIVDSLKSSTIKFMTRNYSGSEWGIPGVVV